MSIQGDLFQPSTPGDTVPVHLVVEMRVDRGKRIATTKCGATVPPFKVGTGFPPNLTGWGCDITCPNCQPTKE